MTLLDELFGKSPFHALVQHTKKVHECVKLVLPLTEALIKKDYDEIHRLQDKVSKMEYEADLVKHEIREHLPRRYFLPVEREEFDNFLHSQDKIADSAEDFAVVLLIRKTVIHPTLKEDFLKFVEQIVNISNTLLAAAEEVENLVKTSFGGAEAKTVLQHISGLGEGEWKADKMQRALCTKIYLLEDELDPLTILFYEKMFMTLSAIANAAENTGDLLRTMIVKR